MKTIQIDAAEAARLLERIEETKRQSRNVRMTAEEAENLFDFFKDVHDVLFRADESDDKKSGPEELTIMSRRHASINRRGGLWEVFDLGSTRAASPRFGRPLILLSAHGAIAQPYQV